MYEKLKETPREDGGCNYRGFKIIPRNGDFMIMEDWDYIQRPPFHSIDEAKLFIDGIMLGQYMLAAKSEELMRSTNDYVEIIGRNVKLAKKINDEVIEKMVIESSCPIR